MRAFLCLCLLGSVPRSTQNGRKATVFSRFVFCSSALDNGEISTDFTMHFMAMHAPWFASPASKSCFSNCAIFREFFESMAFQFSRSPRCLFLSFFVCCAVVCRSFFSGHFLLDVRQPLLLFPRSIACCLLSLRIISFKLCALIMLFGTPFKSVELAEIVIISLFVYD